MFRKELEERLKKIFGLEKVSLNAPSDSFEQDTLFVQIDRPLTRTSQGKVYCRVYGQLIVYSQHDKLTYGFFNKRIEKAEASLTRDFYFYDTDFNVENSNARLQNIHERRASFVFFFKAQYDPNLGELTTLEIEEEEVQNG